MGTMRTIGILGGLAPASTLDYYRIITDEYYQRYQDYYYPQVVIYSLSFGEIIDENYNSRSKVLDAANKLEAAGADFVIAACNSIHKVYDSVREELPIPWITILEPVLKKLEKNEIDKVGLIGTMYTMQSIYFHNALANYGIDIVLPDVETQFELDNCIFRDLVNYNVDHTAIALGERIVEYLRKHGAEAMILACTELPYLFDEVSSSIPVFNTTKLHAKYALDFAMKEM